ncbi:ABC transporter substrate-binding protein [Paenibacillus cremeus]|uniref:Sugar ABC transporter substrate-binding protein n=1 Tax=Paenibacillus cremeus TaxID=2163881 RepID=A0A559K6W8_9BACL|nr:sugar ABC transporter substrate-binding protein [Paenibacillus cremeus]TVY07885.1 sugar ABC transporter substrate-binding protein [Paenibacillus cremeus]
MRKASAIVASAVLMTSILSGCSSEGANQAKESNSGTSKPVKLSLWTFQDLHKKYYEKTAELWNKNNPNQPIELTIDSYPNAEMHNKLLIALQSGVGAPDITDININYFQNFLKGDIQLVELNKIIEPEKDKIVQSRLDIYSKNGKYYGIDFHVGATVVYYNKELLDKAGVNADSIKTWSDYIEAGKKVVSATGKPMTAFEVTGQRPFWPMIVQRGSDYLDAKGDVTLDNEINVKTLQTMKDMIYKDKIAVPMPGGNTGAEEFFTYMNKGGAASLIMPMWYMSRFLEYMPDLKGKVLVRPMPVWEKGNVRSAGMGGTGTAVTKQSKNQDLAMKFLAYAKLSKESNIRIWQELKFDPIRWDVWNDPELQKPDPYFSNEKIFNVLLDMKDEIKSPNMSELSSASQDLVNSNVMFKALKDQSQTPEQALKAAADELRKQKK